MPMTTEAEQDTWCEGRGFSLGPLFLCVSLFKELDMKYTFSIDDDNAIVWLQPTMRVTSAPSEDENFHASIRALVDYLSFKSGVRWTVQYRSPV
jgi:hypothetical protein